MHWFHLLLFHINASFWRNRPSLGPKIGCWRVCFFVLKTNQLYKCQIGRHTNWSTPTHMCNTDPSVLSQFESRDTLRLRTVLPFLMPWIPSWCSEKILISMREQQTNMLELSIWPGALEGHVKTGNQKKSKIYNVEEEDQSGSGVSKYLAKLPSFLTIQTHSCSNSINFIYSSRKKPIKPKVESNWVAIAEHVWFSNAWCEPALAPARLVAAVPNVRGISSTAVNKAHWFRIFLHHFKITCT